MSSHAARMYAVSRRARTSCAAPVVDDDLIRRCRGEFVPVERGVGLAMTDHVCAWAAASPARYRASSSAKAASMSSGSNSDERRDPVVGVDLDDARAPRCGTPRAPGRGPSRPTTEGEALAAGRNDGRRHVRDPDVGGRPHVRDLGIPTVSDPGVHHPTAIVDGDGRRPMISAMASQSRAAKHSQKRSYARLAAFSSRGVGRLSSSNLASAASRSASSNSSAAVDQVAFDRQQVRSPPLGVEALLRGPMRRAE